jgi:hypothetical protein
MGVALNQQSEQKIFIKNLVVLIFLLGATQ